MLRSEPVEPASNRRVRQLTYSEPAAAEASPCCVWESSTVSFHHSYAFMEPGEIVRPGNWGRVLRGYGGQHNVFSRETLWELVREQEFASLPSRLEAAYFYEDEPAARQGMLEGDPNRSPNLYEVRVLDAAAPTHRADLHLWEREWWDVHSPGKLSTWRVPTGEAMPPAGA